MQKSFVALAFVTLLALPMAFADSAALTWKRQLKLSDGRTFVTDGAIAIDAAVAKPAELPKDEASAKVIEGYLAAPLPDEFALGELESGNRSGTYRAPSGLTLNAVYVDFLRRVLPQSAVRLRMKGDLEPVVILWGEKPVGIVMPMKR